MQVLDLPCNSVKNLDEGPTNIRVDKKTDNSVRLVWDLPKAASCYGRTDINVTLFFPDNSTKTTCLNKRQYDIDLNGLEANTDYQVVLDTGYDGTKLASLQFSFKTGIHYTIQMHG